MPMPVDLNLIEGAYLTDLLAQPQALRQTVDGLEQSATLQKFAQALSGGDYKRVVLTGMGSSLPALPSIHPALCCAGLTSSKHANNCSRPLPPPSLISAAIDLTSRALSQGCRGSGMSSWPDVEPRWLARVPAA